MLQSCLDSIQKNEVDCNFIKLVTLFYHRIKCDKTFWSTAKHLEIGHEMPIFKARV